MFVLSIVGNTKGKVQDSEYKEISMDKLKTQYKRTEKKGRGNAADRLVGLRVRILPEAWMSVSCEFYVLSGRGLCDKPILRLKESYRL